MLGTYGRLMNSSNVVQLGYRAHGLAFLYPGASRPWNHYRSSRRKHDRSQSTLSVNDLEEELLDNFFINALVKASTCIQHAPNKTAALAPMITPPLFHRRQRNIVTFFEANTQAYHTATLRRSHTLIAADPLSRDDYLAMLDYYRETYEADIRAEEAPVGLPAVETLPEGSMGLGTSIEETSQVDSVQQTETSDVDITGQTSLTERLTKALVDETVSNEDLYKVYQTLPFPGVSHLVKDVRRTLLRRLSIMEKKTQSNIFWFLSVVDDMKAADLHLTKSEWSSAIYLVGRGFAKVSALEVEVALRTWKEMEQEAHVQGASVTFNILFDIATRAGKFALAEMIMKEMKARNLRISRFTHVGLIYYYGVRGDGNGVRRAYRELVNDGQIVDTAVLNCVIASMLRAGEPAAADQVYERMKVFYSQRSGKKLPPNDWSESKQLGRVLEKAGRTFRKNPSKRQRLQDEQSLAPNSRTYVALLTHHVSHTGELQRVVSLLDDMQTLGLAIRGRFFMELFRGFALHGKAHYSLWTQTKLETVWALFVQLLNDGAEHVHVEKWIVIWTLRAFAACSGQERTLEIWEELKSRWKHEREEEAMMVDVMMVALRRREVAG
ncbi:hypothetical protein MMC13_003907 [Lambiella insularis]|nr:hypothetical protein [Lambiella insularis]